MNLNKRNQIRGLNTVNPAVGNRLTYRGRRCRSSRRGLSLLEVILSIAILGGSMVVIGKLYQLGYRSAVQVRVRNEGNILADSKMAELAAGVLELETVGDTPIENAPGWLYSIEIQPSLQAGLFMATVSVRLEQESNVLPTGVSIVRFVPDPDYEPEEDEE
ncbi:MAG: hypothetical protein AB8B55_18360 [Mariniblastus sp.]